MSKKAVIELNEEELELLDILIGRGIDESPSCDWDDGAKLMANIEEQAKKNRSIIEWHPMSEKPKDESDILVREKDGCVFDTHAFDSVDDGDWEIVRGDKNQIVEWAYPPK